ncbi:non-ribosomal peptide synthetase [Corynebacterium sp. zg-331]|uniref:non-ribosomal peptide synthetase n=1 Tax=unclassified Corynebacterium TaxID=2624378 RepID=UPI00128B49CF|nr:MULTISPECIES: non-ribosomal peptide synthetase [unclassified Corynebacterium]MBC3186414.1 non-ribosomal peptide synthetase [Corynebacterium sp. zg-331]MPV52899.1 AMP-binding protein [Corynebacterium sp. zg331]
MGTPWGRASSPWGGATESGIWSNEHVIDGPGDLDPAWPSVPYGRPLPGQAYRVMDADGREVPSGAVGELWIGGASLASEYLGRADLTADRFVTDADGSRWYRTGDHGYWGDDDLLFFVGRQDNQVKIRGHRVELGDIEHHLRAIDGVEAAVVLPASGNTALRALVVAEKMEDAQPETQFGDLVRDRLAACVPGFMVPRDVIVVSELQLTANGKIDRAWAARVLDGEPGGGVVPGGTGADVAEAWAAVLDAAAMELHGPDANFFALGGDSVGATAVCAHLRARGYRVTVADLFGNPTLDRFIAAVDAMGRCEPDETGASAAPATCAGAVDAGARFPLTPLQRAYALGTDGIRGTVRAATAYSVILGLRDARSGEDPGAGFTATQVRRAAEGIVTRWSGCG